MELNQNAIELAVVDRLTDQIMQDWDWRDQTKTALKSAIDTAFKGGIDAIVSETVAKAVQDGFDYEYQKATDVFGKPNGQTTTIRKELSKLIENYWTAKVDRSGKVSSDSYNTQTRAEWMMIQICGESFSKDLKQEVVNIAAGLKDGLRAQMRASMDVMLSELFHVRSSQDKAEGHY